MKKIAELPQIRSLDMTFGVLPPELTASGAWPAEILPPPAAELLYASRPHYFRDGLALSRHVSFGVVVALSS